MEVTFDVMGEPVPKGRPRVTMRGGMARAYTPKKTEDYEKLVQMAYFQQCRGVKFESPIEIEMTFEFCVPKSTTKTVKTKMLSGEVLHIKRPDVDNLIKSVADALNGIAYNDDAQIVSIIARKRYAQDAKARIRIASIE